MRKLYKFYVLFLLLGLWSCQDDEEVINPVVVEPTVISPELALRDTTYKIMQQVYLWNDQMPQISPEDYATADQIIDALRYEKDKWSYIQPEEEYDNFFEKAEYKGYGFRMAFDEADRLRVAFVYKDSPFGRAGVDRSWTIDKINEKATAGLTGPQINALLENETNTFELIDTQGNTVTKALTKDKIGINTVLLSEVIDNGNTKVGHLVFNSFLATSIDELKPVFQEFQAAGITELILDLRYNGGGRVNVGEYMATNIVGDKGAGRIFLKYAYNDSIQSEIDANPELTERYTELFDTPDYPLNLDRLIVLTSKGTASASELLINGLRPFMEVVLIGENTHGKPVGSFPFRFGGYAISPISFKVVNDRGEGDYFDGFVPGSFIIDDLNHTFNDPEEARLKEALSYINTGVLSNAGARLQPTTNKREIELTGFRQEIGAF